MERDFLLGQCPRHPGQTANPATGSFIRPIQLETAPGAVLQFELYPPIVGRHVPDPGLEVDRGREDEAIVVVGVLANQVHPAWGPHEAHARGVDLAEGGREAPAQRGGVHAAQRAMSATLGRVLRRRSAVSSGSVSLMKAPAPASEPARYFSFVSVRFGG
jgi:hypothetical protein